MNVFQVNPPFIKGVRGILIADICCFKMDAIQKYGIINIYGEIDL